MFALKKHVNIMLSFPFPFDRDERGEEQEGNRFIR